jgi:hypothetical protein
VTGILHMGHMLNNTIQRYIDKEKQDSKALMLVGFQELIMPPLLLRLKLLIN